MSSLIQKIREIGISEITPKDEIKRIKLLNTFCLVWLGAIVVFSLMDVLIIQKPSAKLLTHFVSALFIGVVFFFQYKQKYLISKLLFLIISIVNYFVFSNVVQPNALLEYYFILIPLYALLFIDNKIINWIVLVFSFLCFYLPILLFKHYEGLTVNPVINFVLFLGPFIILNYFKNLNFKNEALLQDEKDKALESNELLAKQQSELAELYAFQNHFMINLSHEIRTPLTLIKGGSSQLKTEKQTNKILDISDRIDSNADKIKHLVDNIIDLAKMNSKKLELNQKLFHLLPFLIKISSSFDSLFSQKEIHYSIENEVENENILIYADKVYLERALCNLIMNAQKYCASGDTVLIRIYQKEKFILFEVKDTGCGIPEEDLSNIFLPFYRAKNSINQAGGSGVGLSFAKEVIELHQGQIKVESELNVGSCFCVELPILEAENNLIIQESSFDKSESKFTGTEILLVEDNREMQAYLKSVLSNFQLTVANNGKEALEKLKEKSFKLLITDYMMPEMDGYQLVQNIKSIGIDIPIIVLTARMDESGKLDFLRLGIDDYLTKPFNEEELLIRIENSLSNYLEKNSVESERQEDTSDFVCEARQVVLNHLSSTDFGVLDLAEALALTEKTLSRRLKQHTGLTPNGFIREVKLSEAKRILEAETQISLKELTFSLGFKNSTHLATLYENRYGVKPF